MATLKQIRDKIDSFFADLWLNKTIPKQEEYFAKYGRYAQVLISPEVLPKDGGEGVFIKRPPTDEKNPDDFVFEITIPIPAQLEIHTYDKGDQHGFTVHVFVEVEGKIYHRAKNYKFGSEDLDWHEVINEKI